MQPQLTIHYPVIKVSNKASPKPLEAPLGQRLEHTLRSLEIRKSKEGHSIRPRNDEERHLLMDSLKASELDRDVHNYDDRVKRYDWSTKASLFNSRQMPISLSKHQRAPKRVDLLYCAA